MRNEESGEKSARSRTRSRTKIDVVYVERGEEVKDGGAWWGGC